MNRSRVLSLFASLTYGALVALGCSVQTVEEDPAEAGEEDLGEAEQDLTKCGYLCPSGWHPTKYSCNIAACGTSCYGPGNSNQVVCQPDSGTFITCGSSCPSGWHTTDYSCHVSTCGHSCYGPGDSNRVECEPNSGTFTTCGSSCPSGWHATGYSCNFSTCGYSCNGPNNSNRVTCAPDCAPNAGTHGKVWITETVPSQYAYHDGWCSIGTSYPAMCWQGTYYYNQSIVDSYCSAVGSGGSCYNADAWWQVTCSSQVDCIYDCNGVCQPSDC